MIHTPHNSPPPARSSLAFYVCAANGADAFATIQLLSTSTAPWKGPRGWGGPSPATPLPVHHPSAVRLCIRAALDVLC